MRNTITVIKYWPVVTTLVIMLAFVFELLEMSIFNVLSPLFGCSLFMAICFYFISKLLRFCLWHRILIINLIVISVITFVNINIYRFQNIIVIQTCLLVSCISIITSLILYLKYGCFKHTIKA